jgi:hypothetical protein
MRTSSLTTTLVLSVALLAAASAAAQQKPDLNVEQELAARDAFEKLQQARELASRIPLQIQVVVSRFQAEKKVSSLPYVISVNANDRETSRLRMGARVPVPAMSGLQRLADTVTGVPAVAPVTYEEIGTNIDCQARTYGGAGQFELVISIEDKSLYQNVKDSTAAGVGDLPVIRSFQSSNTLLMKDGQSRQFTAATDRVSGEVIRVEVTLTVVK